MLKRNFSNLENNDSNQTLESIIQLRNQANEKWSKAVELQQEDYDSNDVEREFVAAFAIYKQCYQALQNLKHTITKLKDFIELYYTSKTLGTAYFDRGEYQTAVELYETALNYYEKCPHDSHEEVYVRNIKYNQAVANLFILKYSLKAIDFEKLNKITSLLIDELLKARNEKSEDYKTYKICNILFDCFQLYGNEKPSLNGVEEDKMRWVISHLLTQEQLYNFITKKHHGSIESFDQFCELISPGLSLIQEATLASFTPPKNAVYEKTKAMVEEIRKFEKSADYAKLKLYQHQKQALGNFTEHLAQGNSLAYFTAATGTGKTMMFLSMIIASQTKAIILAPSRSLVSQTKARLVSLLAELGLQKSIGVFADLEKSNGDITIMTFSSLRSQMRKPHYKRKLPLHKYDMVVVDEAHLAMTELADSLIKELSEDKIVLACTATPEYNTARPVTAFSSLKDMLGEKNCIFEYPLTQAIEDKQLSPIHVCFVTTDTSLQWKRSKKRYDGTVEDLTEKEIAEKINKDKLNNAVAEIYANCVHPSTEKPLFGQQAVVFCAGIEHAKAVASSFNTLFQNNPHFKQNKKIPAAYISGQITGQEQRKTLEAFARGEILVLCGADILITGIDNPNIIAIFNLRPTRSRVMALQRSGRSVRLSPQIPDKIAIVFEFNWVVDNQVFVTEFLDGNHILGNIPPLTDSSLNITKREAVHIKFDNSARWELDWKGGVRTHTVGVSRNPVKPLAAPSHATFFAIPRSSSSTSDTSNIWAKLEATLNAQPTPLTSSSTCSQQNPTPPIILPMNTLPALPRELPTYPSTNAAILEASNPFFYNSLIVNSSHPSSSPPAKRALHSSTELPINTAPSHFFFDDLDTLAPENQMDLLDDIGLPSWLDDNAFDPSP